MSYCIYPLKLGAFENFEKSSFTFGVNAGEKLESPLIVYVVEGEGRRVLFDAGPVSPSQAAVKNHRKINGLISLTEALASMGCTPADFDCVVLSHLHWDHSYNLELFPKTPIYVQREELRYAIAPLPCQYVACNVHTGNGLPQWLAGYEQFRLVEGDCQLAPGLRLLALPGHTPGLQGLLVDTTEGPYLLASDQYPTMENFERGIPAGIHTDLNAWYRSHEKVKALAAQVLPAHDNCVFDRRCYGTL